MDYLRSTAETSILERPAALESTESENPLPSPLPSRLPEMDGAIPSLPTVGYQPMLLVLLAVITGIVLDRFVDLPVWCWFLLVVVGCCGWWCFQRRGNHVSAWVGLILALAGLAASWHHLTWNWYAENDIGRWAGDSHPCCLQLKLASEPRLAVVDSPGYGDSGGSRFETRFDANAIRLRDRREWIEITGTIRLVVHAKAADFRSGDQVLAFGKLVGLASPSNPGQFDFAVHSRRQRRLAYFHVYDAHQLAMMPGSKRVESPLARLRRTLDVTLWRYLRPREAAMASALLLGNRSQLSRLRRDRFVETGTVHLLAISGLHVGILATLFLGLRRFPLGGRKSMLWATIVFVVFYAWLVEFRPPATRASILIVLFCVSRLLGEKGFSVNLLSVAALIVLGLNPTDLFAVGPQLSFLAVATLTLLSGVVFPAPNPEPLERLIANTRSWPVRAMAAVRSKFRIACLASGIIWMFALPLVAYHFHLVTPVALLINPLLLVPITLALYMGMGVLIFGSWLWPLAWMCGRICQASLWLVEGMVAVSHRWDWSHWWTAGPPAWSVVSFYGAMAMLASPLGRNRSLRWIGGVYLFWLVAGWWLPNWIATDRQTGPVLECTFLDVGHGGCAILGMPNGQTWVYDAGSFGAADFAADNIVGALWHQRRTAIDTLVISHADVDHFNAVTRLVNQIPVRRVLVSQPMSLATGEEFDQLYSALRKHHIPLDVVSRGSTYRESEVQLAVLSPGSISFGGNDNADSVVLKIDFQGRTVLLPGDLEGAGLSALMQQDAMDVDLLLAPHHGSRHSHPDQLVDWCRPEMVVISGARADADESRDSYRLPGIQRLGHTGVGGAIRVRLSREQAHWHRWRDSGWRQVLIER